MNILPFDNESSLFDVIRSEAMPNGNLSIRGVAKLAGVADTTLIRGAAFKSIKLTEKLTPHGFEAAALSQSGFPPQAVTLTLEYFAYESKAKSQQAIALLRTFGTIGLMQALESANKPPVPKAPQTYLEALKALVAAEEEKEMLRLQNEQLEKENGQLSEAVDELFSYSSIIRVAKFNEMPESQFSWRKLKAASTLLKEEIKQVPCPRFTTKNLYSHNAWRRCYPGVALPETTTLVING